MKIGKRFVLISGIAGITSIAVMSVFLVTSFRTAAIERERRSFAALEFSYGMLSSALNRLDSNQVASSWERFVAARTSYEDAFSALSTLRELPNADRRIAASIAVVRNLHELDAADLSAVEARFAELRADVRRYFLEDTSSSLKNFRTDSYIRSKNNLAAVDERLAAFDTLCTGLSDSFEMNASVVRAQSAVINEALSALQARTIAIAVAVALILVALGLAFSLFVTRTVVQRLRSIGERIDRLASGDFTIRFDTGGTDELASFSADLNHFIESASASILRIRELSHQNLELGTELKSTADASFRAAAGIDREAKSIDANAVELHSTVEVADQEASRVGATIGDFTAREEESLRSIEAAVLALRHLVEGIEVISRGIFDDRELTRNLNHAAEVGNVALAGLLEHLERVGEGTNIVRETTVVIAEIADRTSMLAMNAAIEAAHAGEAGKGFSIVADEIRRLADAVAESSDSIEKNVLEMEERIASASGAKAEAEQAFASIDERIGALVASISERESSVQGLRKNADSVLHAVDAVESDSRGRADHLSTVRESADSISLSISRVEKVSSSVARSAGGIVRELGVVSESARSVAELTALISSLSEGIDTASAVFQLGGPNGANLEEPADHSAQ